MERPADPRGTEEERRRSAGGVLDAYRERRRRRRAEDTYYGSMDALPQSAGEGLEERDLVRRRSELLEEAEKVGMSQDLAERLYEIAREEGIDPALGFELVRSGLGVAPPEEGVSNAPSQPTADRYLPEWMFPPMQTDDLLRERMLRLSFRRLGRLLQEHEDLDEAFRAFADEPDVGHYGY